MFKSHTPFRMILLSACLWPAGHLTADVLSSSVTNDLVEPANTYDRGAPTLLNMRVKTVIRGGDCSPGVYDGCTLNDVLNDIDGSDDFKPEIKVHMTADDFPDDGLVSNAEMRQRGATSRSAPQKSFRVKLDSSDALWRGERRIQLVKSFNDFSRIRNKLSYDLFIDIPNLPSMRTQFVNFKVEDQGNTEDYGLYTHIEYFGKEYLVRRGWDDDSGVYKAENFYFKTDPAFALDSAGKPVDEDAFEQLMEIKRGDDHTQFVNMLQRLNNPSLDFSAQVFSRHFNKDNYLTWFAVNILLDNYDTNFHNYYLYNPKGSEKFYFVPWDYDLSLGSLFDTNFLLRTDLPRWTQSPANWWGQELHQQFLRQPGNLDLLREAVKEVKDKYLTQAKLQEKADSYYNIVFPLITSSPDINNLYIGGTDPEKVAAYNRIFSSIANKVETNYSLFLDKIRDPMPFSLRDPVANTGGGYTFKWSDAESLTGQTIEYDFEVSTTSGFLDGTIVQKQTGIRGTEVSIAWPYESGNYYYRVIARDADAPLQSWQVAYNNLNVGEGREIYGVVAFYATIDSQDSAPVGNPDSVTINQNSSTVIDVLANDTGAGLVINSTNPWSEKGGSVSIVNNKINYTPASDFTGTDRLWYTFRDSQGRTNFSVVTISVISAAYPVGNPDSVTTSLNTTKTIDVLANDTGSGLVIVSSNQWSENGGSVSIVDNKIVYRPKQGFTGGDRLWYTLKDAQGRGTFSVVNITVSDTNDDYPVANRDYVSTAPDSTLTINVLGNDTGSGLYLFSSNPYSLKGGRVSIVNNRIVYQAKSGFTGEDRLWYVLKDAQGRTNSARVTITVAGNPAFPIAFTDNIETTANTFVQFNPMMNDSGSDIRIVEVNEQTERGGQVEIIGEQLRYTPRAGFRGTDGFWYAIQDSLGRTNSAKVSVTVN